MSTFAVQARFVFTVDSAPISNGWVAIRDGRIVGVTSHPVAGAIDLGNVALLPGLVNAHAHLEFSDLSEPLGPARPFTRWLQAVVQSRRAMFAGGTRVPAEALRKGHSECRESGTALVGDIATGAWLAAAIDSTGPGVIAFQESLGLRPERREAELARLRQFLEARSSDPEHIVRGVSPHAPYSVHPELFRGLVGLANEFDAPIAMHLAETREELELLEQGTGEFVEFLQTMGVWDPSAIPSGTTILDYLRVMATARQGLVVHGNYLREADIAFLAEHPQLAVVYCPRTHAYFGHAPHPWRQLLERGVSVALGTDSRASNPDLSLWKELRFLATTFPEFKNSKLLELGTLSGARALGMADSLGSITPGKQACLAVAELPDGDGDPFEILFEARTVRALSDVMWKHAHP